MKKVINLLFLAVMMAVMTPLSAQTPGTSSDPLVTKSYLDFASRLRKVDINSGTVVTAETGALIVVLSGQLRLEVKKGGMIVNLTNGRKVTSNSTLQTFHLYMVPDGSLCSFKASKDSSLMAMGLNDEVE